MNYFNPPDPGATKWCGVCGGTWPSHRADCPIATGQAQGSQIPSSLGQQLAQQNQASFLGGPFAGIEISYTIEFVGGPLDGHNPAHPAQNYRLTIPDDPSGYYELIGSRYQWIKNEGPDKNP